jgi:pyruvate kinase
MRRTKILATLGPASATKDAIAALVRAGADAIRLNFSHGNHDEHERLIRLIREISAELDRHVPIVGDIQGPKIRIGEVYGTITLRDGEELEIVTSPLVGSNQRVSTPFVELTREVQPGERILLNDGLVELVVLEVRSDSVRTTVVRGGPISSKKGMNFPDTELTIPSVTAKDEKDVAFAVRNGIDYIAASFVQRADDVLNVRSLLASHGGESIGVIAKLEKKQAVENIDSILEVSDGVMVARGDLGVELPPERVPIVQKRILQRASLAGRFAITATQMLESMTTNSRPTRAEASDVANSIFDGTDAVMLSAETASGAYPVESVRMMDRIVREAEQNPEFLAVKHREPFRTEAGDGVTDALAGAADYAARNIHARHIVVFTQSGFTARLISKFRPLPSVLALTSTEEVARRINILWGTTPLVLKDPGKYHEQIVEQVEIFLLEKGLVSPGETLVILMGSPLYERARTNVLRVHQVGGAAPAAGDPDVR